MEQGEGWLVDTEAGRITRSARDAHDPYLVIVAAVNTERVWRYWAFDNEGALISESQGIGNTVEGAAGYVENLCGWDRDRWWVRCL